MTFTVDKTNWTPVTLGEVVAKSKKKVNPMESRLERYVAGEHMDSNELTIQRWGTIGDGYLGPAFHMYFRPGQVLYGSRRAYLRKVALADFEGICANTTYVLEPKDERILLPEFLPLVMSAEPFHRFAISVSKGSTNPYVNWSDIAQYKFLLPPIDEQQRIADLLWRLENTKNEIFKASKAVLKARDAVVSFQYKNARKKSLRDLVSLSHGHSVPSSLYQDEGLPLLRPGDMKSSLEISWSQTTKRIPYEWAEKFSDWILKAGDLVINMTAQNLDDRFLGRVCVAHDEAFQNQRIGKLLPINEEVNLRVIAYLLDSEDFNSWVNRQAEGSKVKHMHWRHIEGFEIPELTDDECRRFLHTMSRFENLSQDLKREFLALKRMETMLTTSFCGGFDVH
ncbi:hypothetical protein BSR28_06950 [Boudabousia liubingyangii]|uniref:restriction endonuclease subunit S n=1 Tax=Boudabousia liubingyangii TaxID=1921764 RepID=UPI00093B309D|nr:restriction endonuclease subunit S [Boudabousia liubingyangii]OKL46272.1 hypothetical protein BSR28_06950 [Boudabousia liubingyangii]